MNRSHLDKVVDAVLYEGYILYPYRPSSIKNRQRFTFGRVYPQAYSRAQNGRERCAMQTQCLIEGASPTLDVSVRFLHPTAREVGRFSTPLTEWSEGEVPDFDLVPELRVGDDLYQTWQEAVEQEVGVPSCALDEHIGEPHHQPFSFPAAREPEPIRDGEDRVVGVIIRRRQPLEGSVDVSAERVGPQIHRITVRIVNLTPVPEADLDDREAMLMQTFASAHTILHTRDGAFVSLMDPPPAYAEAANACTNDGTWPVLVGDEECDERDTMLSSPIILYDYPDVAPESPGNLFDSTEIDELLSLRIKTMTDEEKREMRQADERGRQILERTEHLPDEHLQKLHGAVRGMRSLDRANGIQDADEGESIRVDGVRYRTGDRVRIQPKDRADVMDIALEGMTAVIQAIEQDFEDRVYFALVPEDDPGRDLGMMSQPGHRFFYAPEEVELLPEEERT